MTVPVEILEKNYDVNTSGQPKTSVYGAVVFITLLCCFVFVSGNEIADLKSHINVVCIFIIFGPAHYFL